MKTVGAWVRADRWPEEVAMRIALRRLDRLVRRAGLEVRTEIRLERREELLPSGRVGLVYLVNCGADRAA